MIPIQQLGQGPLINVPPQMPQGPLINPPAPPMPRPGGYTPLPDWLIRRPGPIGGGFPINLQGPTIHTMEPFWKYPDNWPGRLSNLGPIPGFPKPPEPEDKQRPEEGPEPAKPKPPKGPLSGPLRALLESLLKKHKEARKAQGKPLTPEEEQKMRDDMESNLEKRKDIEDTLNRAAEEFINPTRDYGGGYGPFRGPGYPDIGMGGVDWRGPSGLGGAYFNRPGEVDLPIGWSPGDQPRPGDLGPYRGKPPYPGGSVPTEEDDLQKELELQAARDRRGNRPLERPIKEYERKKLEKQKWESEKQKWIQELNKRLKDNKKKNLKKKFNK